MKTYAFIDASNTAGTTRECLSFNIDWYKLYDLMTNDKWNCEKVFLYKGYKGKTEKKQLEKLEDYGYDIKTKLTHKHPDKIKIIEIDCKCGNKCRYEDVILGNMKSNCDVELTIDAMKYPKSTDRVLIFTGDGDFAELVENLLHRGVIVYIVSSNNRDKKGVLRFSTRLKTILEREALGEDRCKFVHLFNWKKRIEKD